MVAMPTLWVTKVTFIVSFVAMPARRKRVHHLFAHLEEHVHLLLSKELRVNPTVPLRLQHIHSGGARLQI